MGSGYQRNAVYSWHMVRDPIVPVSPFLISAMVSASRRFVVTFFSSFNQRLIRLTRLRR